MAGGAWSLRFRRPDAVKVMAVAKGGCLMLFENRPPIRLDTGDVIIVDGKHPFVLTTDPALEPPGSHRHLRRQHQRDRADRRSA